MPRPKQALPILAGTGRLKIARTDFDIRYEVGSRDGLKTGKGWVRGEAQEMQAAFSAGEGVLMMEGGETLPVLFVAHTAEAATVYFEINRR